MYLGASILGAYIAAAILRGPIQGRWVDPATPENQPRRQFQMEMALAAMGAVFVIIFNKIVYFFPALKSGGSVLIGFLAFGFFIGIDMALARERRLITAAAGNQSPRPPERLYSVTRRFSMVAISSVLITALILGMVISKDIAWLQTIGEDSATINAARRSVIAEVIFIMVVLLGLLVNLIISYSKNLKLLFGNETRILKMVRRGDLSTMVPVATKDEFGFIAGHTNHMIEGLRHRMQLVSALKLAEEVQQKLLPHEPPQVPGVEVAGTSIYCDETGGDYYDYFPLPGNRLATVVADASDHGVGAALDMTTARAFLKYGIQHPPERDDAAPEKLLARVNTFLARDSADSGRFTTLFFLEVDPPRRQMRWIRAGQDPALLYDPATDQFVELDGRGVALGLDESIRFEAYHREGWNPGTVVVVATDGLPETRNGNDQFFGRDRIRQIVRQRSDDSATQILEALVAAGEEFRGKQPQADDMTLVVLKLDGTAAAAA